MDEELKAADILEQFEKLLNRNDWRTAANRCELRHWLAKLRAQLPNQGGEAVEVAAWQYEGKDGKWWPLDGHFVQQAIDAGAKVRPLYTHPSDQVADDLTMVKVSRELLEQIAVELEHDNDRYFLGRELRALLNGGR